MATVRDILEGLLSTSEESERDSVRERMLGLAVEGVTGVVDKSGGAFEGSVVFGGCCHLLRVQSLTGGRRAKVRLRIISRSAPGKDDEALAIRVAEMAIENPDVWGRIAVDPRDGEMVYVAQVYVESLEASIESAVDWLRLHAGECLEMTWAPEDESGREGNDGSAMSQLLSILDE